MGKQFYLIQRGKFNDDKLKTASALTGRNGLIELDYMGDDPRPIASGTRGTVCFVDDIGTVHCDFDNGRCLGLIPGEDAFHAI